MNGLTRYIPALVMTVGCLAAADRERTAISLAQPLRSLPTSIDGFEARDLVISPEERRVAGMSEYVFREFEGPGAGRFSVYVGYYAHQTQGRTIHSPRNCLPGAGWETVEAGRITLSVDGKFHEVNRYVLANGDSRALVMYWYQGRGRVAASEYQVKWQLLRDSALRGRSEESLVRIVVPLGQDGVQFPHGLTEDEMATRTAVRLIRDVDRVLPPWG